MKPFMDEEFLLNSETARGLYHGYAEKTPIIDYHCHINPMEIALDKKFGNITQAWLYGDHYKWRAMRAMGVPEPLVTGAAPDYDRFKAWAAIMPALIGNPLYHWTHLELKRYFGWNGILNERTAPEVWELCNEKLAELSVRAIIKQSNVTAICTTDDPTDDLRWHEAIKNDASFKTKVLPAWRPDKALHIERDGFAEYISALSEAAGSEIRSMEDLFAALSIRLDYFAAHGCVATDHGLDAIPYVSGAKEDADKILKKRLNGESCSAAEAAAFQFALMEFLASEYERRGWAMELHFGANRSVNSRMSSRLGPDTGFDCISDVNCAGNLAKFLNHLDQKASLPKTIIFSINPNDDLTIESVVGCFQAEGVRGRVQHGAAWWFNDTKTGMAAHMTALANASPLGNFTGMLTDSRSFLSYTRHEYFRRILCDLIGGWVENGEYPDDAGDLKKLVEDICYYNAASFLGLDA